MSTKFPFWSEYLALRKNECRRLLEELHGTGMPTANRNYVHGSLSYREDEKAGESYILTEGVVKLLRNYSGSKQFVHLLGPWNVFGPLIFGGLGRWTHTEAFTDCKVVVVPWASLRQAVQTRPEIALRLMTLQELRLIYYQELVECLLPRRTEVRLANMFSILGREFGKRHDRDRLTIELPLTHRLLAEMVAVTRESVAAAVRGLCRQKVIQMERKRISILDPEKLAEIGRR